MNFTLNSEQRLLQDSVRRFVDQDYDFEQRRKRIAMRSSGSAAIWQTFADQGWLAAALPEKLGGLGGSAVDTAIIAHEFGRGLVIESYLGVAVLGAQTLLAAATPAQLAEWLPRLADGSTQVALAYSENESRGFPEVVSCRAIAQGSDYVLSGVKTLVLGGLDADAFIVSARVGDADDIGLFLVDSNCAGLVRRPIPLHDSSWAAEVSFNDPRISAESVLGFPGQGLTALRQGLVHATAALCAELVGGMERAIEITAEYLKVRKQFGVPLGTFQALQHRMADMASEMELSRSMLFDLLASIENDSGDSLEQMRSKAKTLIGRSARHVCGQAIQLHGGIGMTEEYAVGHYFRRAVVADALFGSSANHEAVCAAQLQRALAVTE